MEPERFVLVVFVDPSGVIPSKNVQSSPLYSGIKPICIFILSPFMNKSSIRYMFFATETFPFTEFFSAVNPSA